MKNNEATANTTEKGIVEESSPNETSRQQLKSKTSSSKPKLKTSRQQLKDPVDIKFADIGFLLNPWNNNSNV